MPEAVIAATARSPMAVPQKARLEICERMISPQQLFERCSTQVSELNPTEIDDLLMGCGLPGGEQGFNHGRVGAVQLGHDYLPATTITRYCASSLQTTRMALHAIKAGEGEVHISAGVECVSRYVHGNSDSWPSTTNPVFDGAQARTEQMAEGNTPWQDPRVEGYLPDVYIAMGQTAENLATPRGVSRQEQDEFGVRSQ